MFGRRLGQLISILCLAGHKLLVMGNEKPSSQQVAVVRRVKVYQSLGSQPSAFRQDSFHQLSDNAAAACSVLTAP